METLKQMFNLNALRRWMVIFLAGLVVLTTTACGSTQAAVPTNNGSGSASAPQSEGMYPHKDTDMDTRGADAKADRLIRQAEQRIQDNIDKPLGQRVGDTSQDIGQAAKETAKNFGQSTKRAADNAADNARDMVNGASASNQPNS